MLQTYILPIQERIQETTDTISLHFFQPKVDRIPYYPGQYITLKIDIEGTTHFRSYSMSSNPKLDEQLSITIKRVQDGIVSNYIHNNLKEGDRVEFLRPAGRFIAELATKHKRHAVMIAGGSGITPIFSILKGILFQEPYSQVSLLYANSKADNIIFLEQINELAKKFPHRFHVRYVISQANNIAHLPTETLQGRINEERLKGWIKSIPSDPEQEMDYYLCGPTGLLNLSKDCLSSLGIAEKDIHFERFVADVDMEKRQKRTLQPSRKVKLKIGEDIQDLWVPSGATVLEAALSQGIDLPYSCKRGVCATCMGRLLQGTVEMDDPTALLDFEVEAGKVLICQCIPTSENVQIKVGL
ncbi:MAG: ferredoxin--NADP reductase [Bacteroidota bacterium]